MFDDLIKDLQKGLQSFEDNKKDCMQNIGEEFKEKVKRLTPKDTGELQNSYVLNLDKDSVVLDNDEEYFVYINDGHSTRGARFVPGKHMLENGLSQMTPVISKEINDLLKNTKLL